MASTPKKKKSMRRGNNSKLRKAMLHSSLCFLVGLFAGLILDPSDVDWIATASRVFRSAAGTTDDTHTPMPMIQQPQLLVVVTTTEQWEAERRAAGLTRTAHALRLVSPPLVWLVVEAAHEARATAQLLRGTGVVYRHLTYRPADNGSSRQDAGHEQMNLALGHIEKHRIAGVVLFAGLGDVYDLRLLHRLREIRTFGAWAVATVSEYERNVLVEGPLCSTSTAGGSGSSSSVHPRPRVVTGWFSRSSGGGGGDEIITRLKGGPRPRSGEDMMDGFAFSSSLLWDPHRWDRFPLSEPDASQDSSRFVQRLMVDEYNKSTRAMPDKDAACSQVMLWRLQPATN